MKKSEAITKVQTTIIIAIVIIAAIVSGVSYYLFFRPPSKPSKEYIVLGADLPLTGKFAYFGETQKIGFELAIEDINAKGGVYVADLGRKLKLKLIYYNDESDPTKVKTNVERLITSDNVDFIMGPWTTPLALSAGVIVESHKHLMIALGTGSLVWEEKKYNRTFIVYHSSTQESGVLFELFEALPPEIRPTKLAIWEEDSEIGRTYAEWIEKHVEEYGHYEIVYREIFTPGAVDYSSMILKTKEANPEVVFAMCSTTDAVTFLRQSKELGFCPKLYQLQRGGEPAEFWELAGEDAEAVVVTMTGFPYLPIAETQSITQRYKQMYGKEPSPYLPVCYAAVQVLVAAIEKAGTLDRDKVREALTTLEVDTVAGRVEFSGPGHAHVKALVIQWQNGAQQVVWPPELKTAEFEYPKPSW